MHDEDVAGAGVLQDGLESLDIALGRRVTDNVRGIGPRPVHQREGKRAKKKNKIVIHENQG